MNKNSLALCAAMLLASTSAGFAWEPTKPIEIVVPFSAGGASDQMARTIQGIIQKNDFAKTPIIVVNKPAAAGAEAMLDLKASSGDAHKLITTSSGIFLTPMTTRLDVNWKDFTPVAMLAQDAFGLWVNNASPYKSAVDFIDAAKEAEPALKVGGTGSKREDQLIVTGIMDATRAKLIYIPHNGGGAASTQLAGNHIDADTNNPAEEIANWRGGATRPLCVFSTEKLPYTEKVTADLSWNDIPTCYSEGLEVSYQMLRGFFMPGGVTEDQQKFYAELFKKVSESAEWKEYMARNALIPDFREGKDFVTFLEGDETKHHMLLTKAGFLAQ